MRYDLREMTADEWDKLGEKTAHKIPKLKFDEGWEVQPRYPFGGATVRFLVSKGDKGVYVLADFYNQCGSFGPDPSEPVPYWEVAPYGEHGAGRCAIDDVDELLRMIRSTIE